MKLVSACLIGTNSRYDGKNALNQKCLDLFEKGELVPICPEQLGGLNTPREKAEIQKDGSVKTINGKDITESFLRGAEKTLKIAEDLGIKEAILKSKSPSCGYGKIYDGTFSEKLVDGDGVTAAILKKNGIKIITEEDL